MEISPLPSFGSAAGSVLLYGALSLFFTGPLVAERTIERQRWIERCEARIVARARAEEIVPEPIPQLDCGQLGALFGADIDPLCQAADLLLDPVQSQLEAGQRQANAAFQRRLAAVAAQAPTQCNCAVTVVLEDRLPWALHASSFRLVTPQAVRALEPRLETALASPACRTGGGS